MSKNQNMENREWSYGAQSEYSKNSNKVITAKFDIYTGCCKMTAYQFKRAVNQYFLLISLLTLLPLSPKRPETMAGTLAFIVMLSICKESIEDYARHKKDYEVNHKPTTVWKNGVDQSAIWEDIRVGDIIRLNKDDEVPADLILLSSGIDDGKGAPAGYAFVSTANLDGETNLKSLFCLQSTKAKWSAPDLKGITMSVKYEQPTKDLRKFKGNITIGQDETVNLNIDNIVLRGCKVRNTPHLYGLVVYTGPDTRIVQNSGAADLKMSDLERTQNKAIITLVCIEILMAAVLAAIAVNSKNSMKDAHYLQLPASESDSVYFVTMWLVFIISYSHMIPISMILGMEIVKTFQMLWIEYDMNMYWPPVTLDEGDKRAQARTSNLLEEVGQVQYIFSDKTGTLTQNVMEFHHASINGKCYGDKEVNETDKCSPFARPDFNFRDSTLHDDWAGDAVVKDYVMLMAVCNTVIPVMKDEAMEYEAASPDEVALVLASANFGLELVERDQNSCKILDKHDNTTATYMTEKVFEFDSDRKRMSTIVRDPATGVITILTKGADLVMLDEEWKGDQKRAYRGVVKQDDTPMRIATVDQMNRFAADGLRTLIVSKRIIDAAEYEEWQSKYTALENKLCNGEEEVEKFRQMKVLMADLEGNQDLIGCTAIEDKLQDGVGKTIQQLHKANINLWVLTGDKKDTAINIAQSCKLLGSKDTMDILGYGDELDSVEPAELKKKIADLVETHCNNGTVVQQECGLVLQGHVMEVILEESVKDIPLRENMLKLCDRCQSVVCCRMTPSQKAQVVDFVKLYHKEKPITLAIGDGGNDVKMIQRAHVGIGLHGKEGSDAVMASDYALGQFRFLERLLLIHGRYGYLRISVGINYYLYKNICCVFCEVPFQLCSAFSGQNLFPDWFPQGFNAIFTSFNTVFMNTVEQDVDPQDCLDFPELFIFGQRKHYFNYPRLLLWIFWAFLHGFINFLIPYMVFSDSNSPDGFMSDFWYFGTTAFISVCFTVNLKLFSESFYWTVWHYFCAAVSFVFVLLACMSFNSPGWFTQPEILGHFHIGNDIYSSINDAGSMREGRNSSLLLSLKFWYVLFLTPTVCITLDLFLKALYRSGFSPYGINLLHAVQESKNRPPKSGGKVHSNGD